MAQQINEYPLMIDVQTGTLYRDFLSPIEVRPSSVKQGDTLRIVLYGVRQSIVDPRRPLEYADLPANVAIGIGELAAEPEQGVFKLTWDGNTTANLNYNATVAEVQSAVSNLASIVSAGGVTVSGANGGPYRVTWTNVGNRNLFTADTAAVYPPTTTSIYTSRNGAANVSEIQTVVLERELAAYTASFSNLAAANINISTIREGATNVPEIQRVDVSTPTPYSGTFALTFDGVSTDALPYNIDAADLQIALESLNSIGANNIAVTGAFPRWDVSFIEGKIGNQNVMTSDASGLRVPVGKYADLDLATDGIAILVDGETSATATLEIEFPDFPKTYQFEVDVINDLIPSAPSSSTPLPSYYTEAEVDAMLALKAPIASPTFTGLVTAPSLTLTPANNATGLTLTGGSITGSGSTPFLSITGTWNTTSTPSAILVDIVNTASLIPRLLSLRTDGAEVFAVLGSGNVQTGAGTEIVLGNSGALRFASGGAVKGDGSNIELYGGFYSAFGLLKFGGASSSEPALKRSSALLQARLADDSDFTGLQGKLRVHANAAAETPTATHTLRLFDAAGTEYKVLCVTA